MTGASARPLVSAVIPTHNRRAIAFQAIGSALRQRDVDVEVIVVDDGSSDGTADLLRTLDDPRLRVLSHEEPQGVSAARNSGILAARGDWVAFLDDDDLWAPDKLAAQISALDRTPEAQWCCPGAIVVDSRTRVIGWSLPPPPGNLADRMRTHNAVAGGGSGVMAARGLLDAAGLFDDHLACQADWDMWLRLAHRSPIASIDRPLVAYRMVATSMSHDGRACDQELDVLRAKWPAVDSAGPSLDVDDLRWRYTQSRVHRRAGRHRQAFQTLTRAARDDPNRRRAVKAMVVGLAPWSVRLEDFRATRRIPPSWRREAESWLDQWR